MVKKLSEKKRVFCEEYIIDINGARAARDAGYPAKTANVRAAQLITEPEVQLYLNKLITARSERTQISADRVLQELARVGFVDPRNIMNMDENGNVSFKSTEEMSTDDAACIKEISQTVTDAGGSTSIKLYDKLSALEKIGKHLKLFTDVTETRFDLTQMGRVMIKDGDKTIALNFNVGKEPDVIDDKKS